MERRLTTILAADAVGYSRLMGADEAGTLAALKGHRKDLLDPKAAQYRGRTVKLMGDGALMEFASVVDAVQFAVEVQAAMAARNEGVPEDRRIVFRIGINIGDIIVEGDDIYGDGVNIAARLEGLAEPGGICISRSVHTQVRGKLDLTLDHLGEKEVKNIAEPVSVYRVVMDDKAARLVTAVQASAPPWRLRPALIAAGVAVLTVLGGLAWWQPWTPAPRVETAAVPASAAPTLVVLPFDNMSDDADLGYFSDGMTEDIITELSKNPDLKVVSRNTSFTYKGKAVNARQVSEELGVRYVLEGSVRKQGDTVRITAQLIDGATDAHVWAERFDEEGTDIFALQDRVTEKIDATLSGHEGRIRKAEYQRVWAMDAAKLEEYDYYLRGHAVFFGFTPEAMLEAREIWQEGLRKFPDSGLLRVKIGWTYFQFFQFGWGTEPEKDLERAHEWAQEGLTDATLPPVGQWNGHWLNAIVQLFHKRDYELAYEAARTTLEVVPNDSVTLVHLAQVPSYAGNPDLAIEWISRAIDREVHVPDWFFLQLGLAFHAKGDCKRAVQELEKVPFVAHDKSSSLTTCYVELDRLDDAKSEIAKLREAWPDLTVSKIDLWLPYKDQGIRSRVQAALIEAGLPE
jgi:TolB-like protein/class 3 adenylate cyclase/tetratricopeptide (TPR) repeat protein